VVLSPQVRFVEGDSALTKTVILLGTSHRVQGAERGRCNVADPDYELLVEQLWRTFSVDFVFEEASGLGPTFAEKFALEEIGPNRYKDIDPSAEQRKKLGIIPGTGKDHRIGRPNLDTLHWGYAREELIDAHEQREYFWLPFVRDQDFRRALLICGHAHLLSFAFRLKGENLDIRAYSYMPYKLFT
jgi:hypothetical protein